MTRLYGFRKKGEFYPMFRSRPNYHTVAITLVICSIVLSEKLAQVSAIKSLAYSFIPTIQEIIALKTRDNLEDWCRNQCVKSPLLLDYDIRINKLLLPSSKTNYIETDPNKSVSPHPECICMVDKANKFRQVAKDLFGSSDKMSSSIYKCDLLEGSGGALNNALTIDKARRAVRTVSEVCKLLKKPALLTAVNLYAMMQNLFQLQTTIQNLDKKLYPEILAIIDKAKTLKAISKKDRTKHIDTLNLISESIGNMIVYKQAKDMLGDSQIKKLLWLAPYWYNKMEAFIWPVKMPDYERCKWFDSDKYRTDVVFAARTEAKSNIINRFLFLFNNHIEQKCSKLSDPTMTRVYKGPKSFAYFDFVKLSNKVLRNPDAYVDIKPKQNTKKTN